MSPLDISVSFPCAGVIRLRSRSLFGDAENPACRRFLERVFEVEEISNVTITGGEWPEADLYYCPKTFSLRDIVARVAAFLGKGNPSDREQAPEPDASRATSSGAACGDARAARRADAHHRTIRPAGRSEVKDTPVAWLSPVADRCTILYYRQDLTVSDWQVKSDLPGRLRLKNPALYRK